MATILTKRSNTASSVPVAGDLTNSTGGAELAVNTADKRLFTKDSGGSVVELGTNPSSLSLPNGTANGVPYLNGSKVLTSGSALTFDGTNFTVNTAGSSYSVGGVTANISVGGSIRATGNIGVDSGVYLNAPNAAAMAFFTASAEGMRLTSTGLGIGTSTPAGKLSVISGSTSTATNVIVGTVDSRAWAIRAEANDGIGYSLRIGPSFANGYGRHLIFATGDSDAERMRLDSSGNLGLGVTPSAWGTSFKAMQIGTGGAVWGSTSATEVNIGANTRVDIGNAQYDYINNGVATQYQQAAGLHKWFVAGSGTAGNAISFTQAMTLDASGNFMVGTTTPLGRATIYGSDSNAIKTDTKNAQSGTLIEVIAGGSSAYGIAGWDYSGVIEATGGGSGTGGLVLSAYNGPMIFQTNSRTERARIDSSGNLLVGTTSSFSSVGKIAVSLVPGSVQNGLVTQPTTNNTVYPAIFANSSGTTVGYIQSTNTATTYSTSSDYRLKENITPMAGALATVAQLKPVTYTWKIDGSDGQGFIAHELQEVVPDCVTGEKDAVDADGNPVYQGIDTSFLVATLTAAIQELKAEFDAYKASHP